MIPRRWYTGLVVILSVFASCIWTGKGVLPESKRDCSNCHVVSSGKTSGQLKKPVSELCGGCHPDRSGSREHVVDIVPSMTVTGLPLRDGKITCATCHNPHVNRYGSLLRAKPRELCRICHTK